MGIFATGDQRAKGTAFEQDFFFMIWAISLSTVSWTRLTLSLAFAVSGGFGIILAVPNHCFVIAPDWRRN
jgi:hypothetical protein